jgi:peroxiredoxin
MRISPVPCFALWFAVAAGALTAADDPGLNVGDVAPDFTLMSGSGTPVTLAELREEGPVVLVFVRSADWCPYCRQQLQDLEANRAQLEASGAQLVGLSYDNAKTQAKAVAKLELTYPLLADPDSRTIAAYGILNHEARGKAQGVPHPAIFIVDQAGQIRAKLLETDYRDRPKSAAIQAALQQLD